MADSSISDVMLREVALTREEYDTIVARLGRAPNAVELGMFGAMWSEHCGYKNSRPLLKRFPTTGPRVLQGPGENAGAVDIGDGQALVLKIESHNHPSAVEPYQGAATGVGGIVRDIFTMGARPIATLDSLRFGPLGDPDPAKAARNRYLFANVVAGVDDPQASRRGVVQVGDPFREKLLIEACLEALDQAWLVGMQDLGAAGLTSATVECASKGQSGIEIDVARVSRRETGMTPYEVMLSESQERMLVIVRRGAEAEAQAVLAQGGLHSDVIGRVTDDDLVRIVDTGAVTRDPDGRKARLVAELPHEILTNPPLYVRQGAEAAH